MLNYFNRFKKKINFFYTHKMYFFYFKFFFNKRRFKKFKTLKTIKPLFLLKFKIKKQSFLSKKTILFFFKEVFFTKIKKYKVKFFFLSLLKKNRIVLKRKNFFIKNNKTNFNFFYNKIFYNFYCKKTNNWLLFNLCLKGSCFLFY